MAALYTFHRPDPACWGQLMNILRYAALLVVVLGMAACGSSQGNGGGGPGGPGGPGSGGTLLTHGGNTVQTLDLAGTPTFTELGTLPSVSYLPAASSRSDRLYIALHTGAEEFTVGEYDFQNLTEPLDEFTWPGTSLDSGMRAIAFSPDERHVAAIVGTGSNNRLSVLNIEGAEPVEIVSEFNGGVGEFGLTWLNNDRIAFVLDVSGQDAPEVADLDAAVVSLDIVEQTPSDNPELRVHAGITGDAPRLVNEIRDLAASPAGDRLVYSYGDDTDHNIMLKDLTASTPEAGLTQLTSGPHAHVGAAFSPDGTMVAFSEYISWRGASVFIIPVDQAAPIHIEDSGPTRDRHWRADGQAERILAWLP